MSATRRMFCYLKTKVLILSLVFLLIMIKVAGAQTPGNLPQETLNSQMDSEETLYSIKLLRLESLLKRRKVKGKEVLELVKDAEKYAEEGDYLLANIFLDEALKLLEEDEKINFDEYEEELSPRKIDFEKELKVGTEIFGQRFELALETDSAFSERSQNPFCGLRLGLDYEFSSNQGRKPL